MIAAKRRQCCKCYERRVELHVGRRSESLGEDGREAALFHEPSAVEDHIWVRDTAAVVVREEMITPGGGQKEARVATSLSGRRDSSVEGGIDQVVTSSAVELQVHPCP